MRKFARKNLLSVAAVLAFILLLVSYALNKHLAHQRRVNEVVLQQNLWAMRAGIDYFTKDKQRLPASLQELISAGYIREVPSDPLTQSSQTWVLKQSVPDPGAPRGIVDVHSGARGVDSNGKSYQQY